MILVACMSSCNSTQFLWGLFYFSKMGYLYVYSALAQSMAALLGFLGVFGVYRLQIQQQRISDLCRQIREYHSSLGSHVKTEAYKYSEKESFVWAEREVPFLPKQIRLEERKREKIKSKFLRAAVPLALITLFALFLTGQSDRDWWIKIGSPITFVVFIATTLSLLGMFWFAHDCLAEESFSRKFKQWLRN